MNRAYKYAVTGRDAAGKHMVVKGIIRCPFASTFELVMRESAQRFVGGACPWTITNFEIELETDA